LTQPRQLLAAAGVVNRAAKVNLAPVRGQCQGREMTSSVYELLFSGVPNVLCILAPKWGVPESFLCPKWEIRPCDVTRNKFRCDVSKNFPFWTAGCLLNKIDKSYLIVHSSRKNSFGFCGKITINHILFCPTSSTSHHKIKNVTNHHGNAKCPILQLHMALKRTLTSLLANLFLTAALLHVLIQSNGSSSSLSVEESNGFENWKGRHHDTRVPRASLCQ
jgi:hypothetical protein